MSTYLYSGTNIDTDSDTASIQEISNINLDLVVRYIHSIGIKIEDQQRVIKKSNKSYSTLNKENQQLQKGLEDDKEIISNLKNQFLEELALKDSEIESLHVSLSELQKSVDNLVEEIKQKNHELALLQEKIRLAELPSVEQGILDSYPFLEPVREDDMPDLPSDYRSIKYVYTPYTNEHYQIVTENLHSDEHKLSNLRVKIYEQLQRSPEVPLLRCSCCKRPVVLSGNSGIKGEIIGFRHLGEGYIITGEHKGESTTSPKEENIDELRSLLTLFAGFKPSLENFRRNSSFLLLPGVNRNYPGDITFKYNGKSVAVIFSSAGHPLDFIVRRFRFAYEMGYIPLWIMSPTQFNTKVMSNRDISVFSNGYICSIDNDTVNLYHDTGEISLFIREFHKNEYAFLPLSKVIDDAENAIKSLIDSPLWNDSQDSKSSGKPKATRVISSLPIEKPKVEKKPKVKRPKFRISVIDYWEGKRTHIKGNLFIEKIDDTYGILDLSKHRYPALPIYEDIRISDDQSEAELILKDGVVEKVIKL